MIRFGFRATRAEINELENLFPKGTLTERVYDNPKLRTYHHKDNRDSRTTVRIDALRLPSNTDEKVLWKFYIHGDNEIMENSLMNAIQQESGPSSSTRGFTKIT